MGKWSLTNHPDGLVPEFRIGAKVTGLGREVLKFEFVIVGNCARISLPQASLGDWADNLWQQSCFEAFIALPDSSYLEYNFSPSTQWAAYSFESYRDGMMPLLEQAGIDIFLSAEQARIALTTFVELPSKFRNSALKLALSAVIEESDGSKSYWALAHPPGAPDFHHPTCFASTLPAPDAA